MMLREVAMKLGGNVSVLLVVRDLKIGMVKRRNYLTPFHLYKDTTLTEWKATVLSLYPIDIKALEIVVEL